MKKRLEIAAAILAAFVLFVPRHDLFRFLSVAGAIFLAVRTIRLGREDRRGALRLAGRSRRTKSIPRIGCGPKTQLPFREITGS